MLYGKHPRIDPKYVLGVHLKGGFRSSIKA